MRLAFWLLVIAGVVTVSGGGIIAYRHFSSQPTQSIPQTPATEPDDTSVQTPAEDQTTTSDNLTVEPPSATTTSTPLTVKKKSTKSTTISVAPTPTTLTPSTHEDVSDDVVVSAHRYLVGISNASSAQLFGHTEPEVKYYSGVYYLYYRNDANEIALATSNDGDTWSEQGVMLATGLSGSSNGVANSSAELGPSEPDDWFHSGSGTNWSTSQHYTGSRSLNITTSGASADWRAASFAVNAGTSYKLHTQLKGQVTGNEFFVTLRWFSSPGGNNFISEVNLPVSIANYTSWTSLSTTLTAPTGAVSADVVIRSINGSGDINFDDVSVRPASWDDTYVVSPSVQESNGTYYLFYEGNDGTHSRIGYATASSPAGPFTKHNTPILQETGTGFEGASVGTPAIAKVANTWYLFYHGYNGTNDQIGLAWSDDLTTWTRHPSNPILPVGSGWQALKVAPSSVYVDQTNGYTYVAYEGADVSGVWSIGIAYVHTADLKTAVLIPQSSLPQLSASASGWDNDYVQLPSFVLGASNVLSLYYSGHNLQGDSFSLGHTSLVLTPIPGT